MAIPTRFIAGFCLVAWVSSASAYPEVKRASVGASWLLKACNERDQSQIAQGYCDGFIEAAWNTIDPWCVPQDVSIKNLREFVISDLRASLQSNEIDGAFTPAVDAVTTAISRRWPCE